MLIEKVINSEEKSSNPAIFGNKKFPWPIFPRRKIASLGPSLFIGIQTVMSKERKRVESINVSGFW